MLRDGAVEHAADRNPVDRSALHAEADEATREDVDGECCDKQGKRSASGTGLPARTLARIGIEDRWTSRYLEF
jgi:hypothetical protein